MLKILKITAYIACTLWAMIGLFIIGSIVHSTFDAAINIVMGLVFVAIAYFLYLKTQNSFAILKLQTNNTKPQRRFLKLEFIFFAMSFLFGLLLLSGTISRVFVEKMAVFG